ncbi:MAG: hypothetical protein E3J70_01720 [Candidatus Heimdallarchaeota archaeon]|nr:MAG: hypothetical protein E3J70_01720 [Candidatus Heimdallarchaeota archaeon]
MSLRTLGAVLKFTLDIEQLAITFYETAVTKTKNQELIEVISSLIKYGNKRIKKVKRIRRENTTEMILEPIKDLESEPFQLEAQPKTWDDNSIKEHAKLIELKIAEFYTVAASKVSFLGEVAYNFEQLAESHHDSSKMIV